MTIKDIARESGYAIGTVSRVLNDSENVSEKARKKILEVVAKHNFVINSNAKNLKQQLSKNIVVMVKGARNMLFASIIEELQTNIVKNGYVSILDYFDEDENEVERALILKRERKPQGFLFLGGARENFDEKFHFLQVPAVLVTNSSKNFNAKGLQSVSIDDEKAAFESMEYLISCGHREIGIIGGNVKTSEISKNRLQGVKASFEKNNVPFSIADNFEKSRFSFSPAYDATCRLLRKNPKITAIFAMSDVMAMGAMRALSDCGKIVPGDVSVLGFDGIEFANFLTPRLTTVKQDEKLLARNSVGLLMAQLSEVNENRNLVIPHQLVIGESVKKI